MDASMDDWSTEGIPGFTAVHLSVSQAERMKSNCGFLRFTGEVRFRATSMSCIHVRSVKCPLPFGPINNTYSEIPFDTLRSDEECSVFIYFHYLMKHYVYTLE